MQTVEKIITILFSAIEKGFETLMGLFSSVPQGNKEYNASFGTESLVLSQWNKGFNLTGTKKISLKLSHQNALCIASTGGGKSSVVLIPTIFSAQGSFVINDPSGELFDKTAGHLQSKGFDIKVLNYTEPENSSGYNPVIRANSSSEIQKLASTLIENSLGEGKSKDPFWTNSAISLLSMIISILKTQDKEFQNLCNVRSLLLKLSSAPEALDSLFSEYADAELFDEYKSFVAQDDKITSGVISTCKAALFIFGDQSVCKTTSFDSIDFSGFRERPTALYIRNKVSDMAYYSPLTSIFFTQFFAFIMSRFPAENERDIFFLIDEASSLKISTLGTAAANVRKHRAGILLLVQDFNQLVNQYGRTEAYAIKQNCHSKLFFPGQSLESAKELEQILGRHTVTDKEGKKTVRPLMTADEIRIMSNALLICGNEKPLQIKLTPYYKQTAFRSYSQMPPPVISSEVSARPVPLLPLNYKKHDEQAA